MGVQYTGMDFGRFGLAAAPSNDRSARLRRRADPELPERCARPAGRLAWIALLALGVESDTEQTTLPRICCVLHSEMQCGEKMQDLEKMAAKLLETARKLPPGAEQHALLEQIRTFRIKLSAVAAKRKELQSASQVGP